MTDTRPLLLSRLAVDQDFEVVDVYLQAERDGAAAKRFFRCLRVSTFAEWSRAVA